MDRHNNRLAVGIGERATSTEDVILRVRAMMERAIANTGGSGVGETPRWREMRYWSEGRPLSEWSPTQWPDNDLSDHMRAYRQRIDASGRPERESVSGGSVQVRPHMREGHPVSGHTRSSPATQ